MNQYLFDFVNSMKESLLSTSEWAVAIKDYEPSDDGNLLSFVVGDFIRIVERTTGVFWLGVNDSADPPDPEPGHFPHESVRVLVNGPQVCFAFNNFVSAWMELCCPLLVLT